MKARRTKSRFASKPLTGRPASLPPFDHPALTEGRTLYPSTVREPRRDAADQWALKSGENSAKIGGLILKGRWHGFPIYTLTLEERATRPRDCRHWRSCFGNGTHLADRIAAGQVSNGVWSVRLRYSTSITRAVSQFDCTCSAIFTASSTSHYGAR
jgi:hypothetical protein